MNEAADFSIYNICIRAAAIKKSNKQAASAPATYARESFFLYSNYFLGIVLLVNIQCLRKDTPARGREKNRKINCNWVARGGRLCLLCILDVYIYVCYIQLLQSCYRSVSFCMHQPLMENHYSHTVCVGF